MEKWGDHLEKKFIVDNVIQALIPFKKGIGAYRSCMYIWGSEFQFGKKGIIFEVGKITYGEAIQNLLKSCLFFSPPKEGRRVLMEKKL